MPTQNLIQTYTFRETGKVITVNFPINRDLQFRLLRNGENAQMVCSPFNVFACINDSKLRKAYAKCERNKENTVSCYMRWPTENIIYKWGDYWDVDCAKDSINWNAVDKLAMLTWQEVVNINDFGKFHTPAEAWTIKKLIDKKAA